MRRDMFGNSVDEVADKSRRRRECLTFRGNVQQGRHGWLRLTPAYSLHLVQEILGNRSTDELVLDPFSGTGTTPLASGVLGIPAHAVEINPFLVWLGNLKLRRYETGTADDLRLAAADCLSSAARGRLSSSTWVPGLHQIHKWWDRPVLEKLALLLAQIDRVPAADESPIRDLLKVAFCRVLIESAHVSFGHQSMSFRKRPTHVQQSLIPDDEDSGVRPSVAGSFLFAVNELADTLTTDQPLAEARVYLGDARDLEKALPKQKYTTVMTSPPYPNRMSYVREMRPYMYWLGYLTNGREAGDLDWRAIGGTWGCATSNLARWAPDPDDKIPYPRFDHMVAAIARDHDILGRYVQKYFYDMKSHLASLRRVMADGGRCYYIIGNSKFYGTIVPAEEIYAALFEYGGFTDVHIDRLRKRNSKKELFEFVVYAQVPRRPARPRG